MRILICTGIYPPDIGGPATYSKLLSDELPRRGFEIKVLNFGEVRHLPKIVRHIIYFWKALKLGYHSDIIFAQDAVSVGLPSFIASKILRKKFVLKIVGDYAWEQYCQRSKASLEFPISNFQFPILEDFQNEKLDFITELRKQIERWVAKQANKIIVPSEYLKKIILMWGIKENKINVIYNSFEPPTISISKDEVRKKLGLTGTVLLSAGRLVPWKGFDILIETMPEIIKEIPDTKLLIIGSGPEEKNLKSQISNLKIIDKVFLLDQLPHEILLKYLKASDIFVLNTGYEGFSHQLLEAMATGIPIITTNVGGNPELIKNKENGILIEFNNKEQLKKATINLYKDRELKNQIIQNAKEKIKEFNKEKMIKEIIKVLR